MLTNIEVISTLNGLTETCKDGQEGFRSAADGVTDTAIRQIFLDYSLQRSTFAGELQALVHQIGGTPETTGSVAAAFHRGWINIKTAVTGKNEHDVLAECVRGEAIAVANYRNALEKSLPESISSIVRLQYDGIRKAHDRIGDLKIVIASPVSA